jgi:hypothetical protein
MANNKEKDLFAPPSKDELQMFAAPSQEEMDIFAPPTKEELKEPKVEEEISPLYAGALGAAQGATFGFADEAEAGVRTLGGLLGSYEEAAKTARERYAQAQEQQPTAFMAGDIGASLATIPLGGAAIKGVTTAAKFLPSIARGAQAASTATQAAGTATKARPLATAAGIGALERAGRSEQEGMGALEDAATGAGLGLAGGAAGRMLGKALAPKSKEALEKSAEQSEKVAQKLQELIEKSPQKAREFGLSDALMALVSPATLAKKGIEAATGKTATEMVGTGVKKGLEKRAQTLRHRAESPQALRQLLSKFPGSPESIAAASALGGVEDPEKVEQYKTENIQNTISNMSSNQLKQQASGLSEQYGKEGLTLATKLQEAADAQPLRKTQKLFNLMQNPEYRKMMRGE